MIKPLSFSSEGQIRRTQWEGVKSLLHYVSRCSPFYQRLFRDRGITLNDISDWRAFSSIPFTTKHDLHQQNWDFLCVPRQRIAEYTATSGTLGKPVTIALTPSDVDRLAQNECLSFQCAGGGADDLYQLMLTLDRQFMAGIAYYEGIRKLGAGLVRVGPGLPALQWNTIHQLRPSALVAVPSFLLKLLEHAEDNHIEPNRSSVNKVICIGESIRNHDLTLNALGRRIAERWNVQLYATYASTEMQTAFTECHAGRGGHLIPELIYVELIDEEGQPVNPGSLGEVVITTLGVEGMPLLRYKTGDMARGHVEPCACGRNSLRLGPIEGRKLQMIKLRGTTLYPPTVFEVLRQLPFVKDYVVEATTTALGTDHLKLHIAVEAGAEEAQTKIAAAFQSSVRVVPEIVVAPLKDVENLQMTEGSRKLSRFLDRRRTA